MNNKIGNVQKCPNCGAPYVPGTKKSPECGHVFQNVGVVSSAQNFSEGINKLSDREEIKCYINNFPIPSAKDDLLEFITSMAARRSGMANPYEDAYRAKLNESINKAKLYFPDDAQFAPLIERFTKLSFENLPSGSKMGVILAGLMVAALIIGLIGQCAGLS